MKQSLQLKLSQHLTLTPQLQQSIRLLQLSTVELNQELERYLADNPLLEREEPEPGTITLPREFGAGAEREAAPPPDAGADSGPAAESEDGPEADAGRQDGHRAMGDEGEGSARRGEGRDDFNQYVAAEPTLHDHLMNQLALLPLPDRDRRIASVLIAHVDEDGYLPADLGELSEAFAQAVADAEPEEIAIALRHVQNLEPTGVGARDAAECLRLQLEAMVPGTPHREAALTLVTSHLEALAARDFGRLKRSLSVDDAGLRAIHALILTLDPKPGRAFGGGDVRYVVPDVVVRRAGSRWVASLNREALPRLRVNKMYADILQSTRDNGGRHLAGQLQEARWLVKNVQQRFDTILRVTQAIVDRQRNFFDHGEVAMRPLVLREIAEAVGLHESTISRVTTQKYMLTPRGLFELKYFFGSHVSTDTGGACSATAIRALIRQLVAAEDAHRPLSDHRISDLLAEQGIQVARRTIAKYRETMRIQPANLRKSI